MAEHGHVSPGDASGGVAANRLTHHCGESDTAAALPIPRRQGKNSP
ncbi:MAG: hypothetical protein ACREQ5_24030 [Candidatus Dormibacteria bacterium]